MTLLKCACRFRARPLQLSGTPFRRNLSQVNTADERFDKIAVNRFIDATDNFKTPVVFPYPRRHGKRVSTRKEEFSFTCPDRLDNPASVTVTERLSAFGHKLRLPYELITAEPQDCEAMLDFLTLQSEAQHNNPVERSIVESLLPLKDDLENPHGPQFHRFDAPIALLYRAAEFNRSRSSRLPILGLYIAQCPIDDLPAVIQHELQPPRVVRESGAGDVYGSSIWMGLEPTNTPLHRDPNPNLFVQIRGEKVIRMLPPRLGEALFRGVQRASGGQGSAKIRGAEMMAGPQSELLHEKVWGEDNDMLEAELGPGDAVYVPLGWWHSVMSVGEDGDLNASANWWFR